jgi:hypothetical protein
MLLNLTGGIGVLQHLKSGAAFAISVRSREWTLPVIYDGEERALENYQGKIPSNEAWNPEPDLRSGSAFREFLG